MSEWILIATNVVLGIEIIAALVLAFLNWREVDFLDERVKPRLRADEDLPLFHALSGRAKYTTFVGVYFIVLTGIGAIVGPLSEHFPPLRAISGALLLGLLAGPRTIGAALRKREREKKANGHGDRVETAIQAEDRQVGDTRRELQAKARERDP